ncbi:MAG: hypothetical protein HHJ12_19330 [Glaciimonas sp.]|nr:hypothetical protein [Glaciimonas sp.]
MQNANKNQDQHLIGIAKANADCRLNNSFHFVASQIALNSYRPVFHQWERAGEWKCKQSLLGRLPSKFLIVKEYDYFYDSFRIFLLQ